MECKWCRGTGIHIDIRWGPDEVLRALIIAYLGDPAVLARINGRIWPGQNRGHHLMVAVPLGNTECPACGGSGRPRPPSSEHNRVKSRELVIEYLIDEYERDEAFRCQINQRIIWPKAED